ncbi:uncharacterized protein LOC109791539, partial [Cajanus cajan]|uniref:uncharacterized protein LOC109791539 n=1 Tax=Cajanus cajan TaxID=3821 RepID=UPI00098DA34C
MIEDHLSSLAGEGDWLAFNKTLALAVFGMILFPFYANTVDHAAMDAFFAWDVHMKSPVPAILADTLLSVHLSQQKQGKIIRCCTSLLYVWGITHFYASSHMGTLPDPLRSFSKIPVRRRYASEWKEEMEQWSIDHFTWVCPWFHPSHVLMRCGSYPSIPLIGLSGCIAYSPRLVMRQLMRAQIVPTKEELGGLCFGFDSEHQRDVHAIIRAWEKATYEGDLELEKPRVSVSIDYEKWRSERGVSQPSTSCATTATRKVLQEQVNTLTKKLEIQGAQMRVLEEKNEESSFRIDGLQRQCKKKDHEIERLKDECANLNEETTRASKMPKVEPSSQLQEVNAKIAHLEAEHARQAQLIKNMQEDLLLTRSDAQQWRE